MSKDTDPKRSANEAVRSRGEQIVEYFTDPCSFCGQGGVVRVFPHELRAWERGAKVQDAFEGLPAGERELLISGTHSKCWDDAFGGGN